MICTVCHRDLPEGEFYPSSLKRGWHICKKCHNKKTAPSVKKYQASLKTLDDLDFNRFWGGFTIKVLNFARDGEYRYSAKSTDGSICQTNDKGEFVDYLKKVFDI